MYTDLTRPASRHVWAYILLQVCVVVLSIVNLALEHWFSYCWWKFGLFAGETFYPYDSQFDGENTITQVKTDVCDSDTTKDYIEQYCPSFCQNIENFEAAGIMMLCFALLALVFTLVSIGLHVLLILRKRNGAQYENELIVMWLILPALAYFLAFVLYLIACNLAHLDKVQDYELHDGAEPENPRLGPGLGMGIGVTSLYIVTSVYGMFTTRKEF